MLKNKINDLIDDIIQIRILVTELNDCNEGDKENIIIALNNLQDKIFNF